MNSVNNIQDRVRGSLMAGAAGDALGYAVEFVGRKYMLDNYGERGITEFELGSNGKAAISDDTQMTLFTANGLLNVPRLGVSPHEAIERAYLDWYNTQVRAVPSSLNSCWLSGVRRMYALRAPGNTCMSALRTIVRGGNPMNDSKGCGGIMRVAPIPLFAVATGTMDIAQTAMLACSTSSITHLHPLGCLPSALLAMLIYRVMTIAPERVRSYIDTIVLESLDMLDTMSRGRYESSREALRAITIKALQLAHSDVADHQAIELLGGGWVAEETWAIALYAAVRHIDSVEDAIIASVNHDGDSDSTGAVCGNIMGAIYGYEHIKARNIFCPAGRELEQTLELSDVILTIADDIAAGYILGKDEEVDSEAKRQWKLRYYDMKPEGINP